MTEDSSQTDRSENNSAVRGLREESRAQGVEDLDNLPYCLRPAGAKVATLLVHGFTATPWEMRLLADFLSAARIASLAIRLPGHGTTPEDLADRRWQEWQDSVIEGYRILNNDFNAIYGIGMSTGSLLLLSSATQLDYRGLVLFSPYLRILHKLAPMAGLLRWIQPYHVKQGDPGDQGRYYSRRPLAGIHQVNRLIRELRPKLNQVDCPVLAFNGEGDATVDITSSLELMQRLGSAVKIHEIFGQDVPHVLTREGNPCRVSMFTQSVKFVQELENPGRPPEVK